jgi:hypothetical protein
MLIHMSIVEDAFDAVDAAPAEDRASAAEAAPGRRMATAWPEHARR